MALCLIGCGANPVVGSPAPAGTLSTPVVAAQPLTRPTHFSYEAIGASGNLQPSGLNPDGTAEVAPVTEPMQATFLNWSPELALTRPVVVLGHVNGRLGAKSVPGVFAKLATANVGDLVMVDFDSGATVTYRVQRREMFRKAAFPAKVYDPVTTPTLTLITCGGPFDLSVRSYVDNVVVTAVAT